MYAQWQFNALNAMLNSNVAGTLEMIQPLRFHSVNRRNNKNKQFQRLQIPVLMHQIATSGSVFEYARSGNQNIFGGASGVTYSGLMLSGSGQKIIGGTTPVTVNDSLIYSGTAIHSGTINRSANMWLVYAGTSPMTTSSELLSTSKKLKIRNTGGVTIDKSLGAISDLWGQVGTLSTASFSVSITSGELSSVQRNIQR